MSEEKTFPVFSVEPCPEEFAKVFALCGAIAVDCQACGRTHFDNDPCFDWEENEFMSLQNGANCHPEQYIGRNGTVVFGYLFGKQVVPDCPCGYATFVSEMIWNDKDWIMRYIAERAKEEAKKANATLCEAQAAQAAIDNIKK